MKKLPYLNGETICFIALGITILAACVMNIIESNNIRKNRKFTTCPLCGLYGSMK